MPIPSDHSLRGVPMLLKCRTNKLRRKLSLFAKNIVTCRADGFYPEFASVKAGS